MMNSEQKIALVTGANGGIGKAIVFTLAKQGYIVIGTGVNDQGVEDIKTLLNENHFKGSAYQVDVTDGESIQSLFSNIKSDFGLVNILVNNAGITRDNLMLRMSDDEWQKVIDTNLTSIFKMSKACLRDMVKARWGRIVNLSSIVGVVGNPGQANYAAAKAGILGFSKSLAYEVASRGITVNCIAPGFIDTPMTQKLTEEQKQAILDRVPMKRLGQPEEVANLIAYLVSPMADYITGQTIHLNGGMYMSF